MPSFSSAPVYDTSKWLEDFYMLLYRYTLSNCTHTSLITNQNSHSYCSGSKSAGSNKQGMREAAGSVGIFIPNTVVLKYAIQQY
jgi:hypothetical protein